MITTVKTDLYASPSPLEWATIGNGILFTAQIPIDENGQVVDGGIEAQARQTLDNLSHTLEKAGGSLKNITQVLIYVTEKEALPIVNKVYAEYFEAPYPNRAAMIIAGLARDEMKVEMVAYAAMDQDA
ncbi:RidA family protein [Terasakiella pusilla]|uniref:RidA family protein n=1 Tax=Terasakiella pusilla TaxID=64973 RepID=UPI00048E6EC2|nr:RidA family protein [Terasakiella pusilla]